MDIKNILSIIALVVLFISGFLSVILVLMHSGKGTGVSDMIASSMYNSAAGSGVWEQNLDRLTVLFVALFVISILVLTLTFPTGSLF